jgi:hypothetical protein
VGRVHGVQSSEREAQKSFKSILFLSFSPKDPLEHDITSQALFTELAQVLFARRTDNVRQGLEVYWTWGANWGTNALGKAGNARSKRLSCCCSHVRPASLVIIGYCFIVRLTTRANSQRANANQVVCCLCVSNHASRRTLIGCFGNHTHSVLPGQIDAASVNGRLKMRTRWCDTHRAMKTRTTRDVYRTWKRKQCLVV